MQRHHRTGLLAASVSLLAMVLAASGAAAQVATLASPDESPVPDEAVSATALEFEDREEAILAFAQCMRDHGLEMDDPQVGEGGGRGGFFRPGARGVDASGEEFQVARQACAPILEAARPELDPAAQQERLEVELAMAQCLRDTGYAQYPDPTTDGAGRLQRGGQGFGELGIDFRSEAFRMARQTCAESLGVEIGPGGGRGPGAG